MLQVCAFLLVPLHFPASSLPPLLFLVCEWAAQQRWDIQPALGGSWHTTSSCSSVCWGTAGTRNVNQGNNPISQADRGLKARADKLPLVPSLVPGRGAAAQAAGARSLPHQRKAQPKPRALCDYGNAMETELERAAPLTAGIPPIPAPWHWEPLPCPVPSPSPAAPSGALIPPWIPLLSMTEQPHTTNFDAAANTVKS